MMSSSLAASRTTRRVTSCRITVTPRSESKVKNIRPHSYDSFYCKVYRVRREEHDTSMCNKYTYKRRSYPKTRKPPASALFKSTSIGAISSDCSVSSATEILNPFPSKLAKSSSTCASCHCMPLPPPCNAGAG